MIKVFDRLLKWTALIFGGVTLTFMMCFIVWNTLIMRKAMNAPIQGAEDILALTLVLIVAIGIPYGARTGAHIEIEVMESSMSAWFARWSMVFVKILGFVLLLFMSWCLFHAGQKAVKFGETTQQLLISFEPFYYALAVSVILYAFVLLLEIWQLITKGEITKSIIESDAL